MGESGKAVFSVELLKTSLQFRLSEWQGVVNASKELDYLCHLVTGARHEVLVPDVVYGVLYPIYCPSGHKLLPPCATAFYKHHPLWIHPWKEKKKRCSISIYCPTTLKICFTQQYRVFPFHPGVGKGESEYGMYDYLFLSLGLKLQRGHAPLILLI